MNLNSPKPMGLLHPVITVQSEADKNEECFNDIPTFSTLFGEFNKILLRKFA